MCLLTNLKLYLQLIGLEIVFPYQTHALAAHAETLFGNMAGTCRSRPTSSIGVHRNMSLNAAQMGCD